MPDTGPETLPFALGDSVAHTGRIGSMTKPTGIVTRSGQPNSLLSVVTYGISFPHGYYLVPENELVTAGEAGGTHERNNSPMGV